ncbi:MAG: hypothetical protein ACLP3R_05100, partial [Candidatus Korobacteraceae bacterium]
PKAECWVKSKKDQSPVGDGTVLTQTVKPRYTKQRSLYRAWSGMRDRPSHSGNCGSLLTHFSWTKTHPK